MPISSTYRVQLRPQFPFAQAAELADYLRELGVGALYASPMLTPTPGSQHGYDVVDPTAANPELGGEDGRRKLVETLRENGLGLVVDIVPNHMAVEIPKANKWWWDVLARGQESDFASYFDIDFARGPILIPVLGSAEAIEELSIVDGELRYHEHAYPIAEGTETGTPQEVHERQHYRLVDWRRGASELTYRRFFDVSNLAAVRMEDENVFAHTHGEPLRWVAEGDVDGLRVDHPDGLTDPGDYLRRLAEAAGERCWLVVEKILEPGETLPQSWPVDGTTGYDALREICGVFVDERGIPALTELADSLDVPTDYADTLRTSRAWVTDKMLVAEVNRIAACFDYERDVARSTIAAVLGAFEVYRSYLPEGDAAWSAALARVTEDHPDLAEAVAALDDQVRAEPEGELARRLQQTSGMVVAKGTEDTAFYRYTRFVAANEVGGAPEHPAVSPAEFHRGNAQREASYPRTMTTLSTHDTKRSEDVRARLAVLAEIPEQYAEHVRRWTQRRPIEEPALNSLAWQTIVGAWPIDEARLRDYLDKASKEGKLATSWLDRDLAFEERLDRWPAEVLADTELTDDIAEFVSTIERAGWSNSLGQKLLQLAGPGIPDVYQGTELFDWSLVDPDNRRDVDFARRRELLRQLADEPTPAVDASGAAKLHVVRTVLRLRRDKPELFTGYRAVQADGRASEHVIAFARKDLLAVATRFPLGLAREGWQDTTLTLPAGRWTEHLTGQRYTGTVHCGQLLDSYPVAVLERV